jgi:hypothetical protein
MTKGKKFEMDERRKSAAEMLALGGMYGEDDNFIKMNKTEIAEYHNITYQTLRRWEKDEPEFSQEVDRVKMNTGLAKKSERVNMAKKVAEKALEAIMAKLEDADAMEFEDLDYLLAEGRRWLELLRKELDGDGKGTNISIQNNVVSLDDLSDRFQKRSRNIHSQSKEGDGANSRDQNPYGNLLNNGDDFIDESDKVHANDFRDEE